MAASRKYEHLDGPGGKPSGTAVSRRRSYINMANGGQKGIPWYKLVSNLSWFTGNPGKNPDVRLLSRSNTEGDLSTFTRAFIENIQAESKLRYSQIPDQPSSEWDETIVTDTIVEKISPTVRRTFHDLEFYFSDTYAGCDELIPRLERETFAFLRPYQLAEPGRIYADGEHYPVTPNGAFYNAELVKILLLHGEMGAVMGICKDHRFLGIKWWGAADERDRWVCPSPQGPSNKRTANIRFQGPVVGWDYIYTTALRVYIGLHVLRRFMPSRNSPSGARGYRETRAYQYLLRSCTITRPVSKVATHPHREFFGIADGQFNLWHAPKDCVTYEPVDDTKYGIMPFEEFLAVDGPVNHIPSLLDVRVVQSVLKATGLPTELVLSVMDCADYSPRAKLVASHDPLHPLNKDVLDEHLKYCWELLVRCEMVRRTWKHSIDWEDTVQTCVVELFCPDKGSGSVCKT